MVTEKTCPRCGLKVSPEVLRCPRCNAVIDPPKGCSGACSKCTLHCSR